MLESFFFSGMFLSGATTLIVLVFILFLLGTNRKNRIEPNRIHEDNAYRWGGAIAGGIFLASLLWDARLEITPDILWLFIGAICFLVVGVIDDMRPIPWKWQLFAQIGIVGGIVWMAGLAVNDIPTLTGQRWVLEGYWLVLGSILAFVWFLLIINALNWIDGVDGLAPGVVVVSALALGAVALRPEVYQPPVAIVAFSLAGSFLALWMVNIAPARFYAGTAGVYMAGFIIAYLSIFAGVKVATAFLVLALPIMDAFRVIVRRVRRGAFFAHGDTSHVHHLLLRLGWTKTQTSFFLLGMVGLTAWTTLIFDTLGKVLATIFVCVLACIFVFVEWRKYRQ